MQKLVGMKNTTRKIKINTHNNQTLSQAHKIKITHNYNATTQQEPTTMYTDTEKAKQSYYADILWTLLNFAFLGVWLYQIINNENDEGKVTIFDSQFMENGFCNLPSLSGGGVTGFKSPTQIACFVFDSAMAAAVIYYIWKVPIARGMAGYLVVHGLAHGLIYMGKIDPTMDLDTMWETVILAAILSMGALGVYQTMIDVGKNRAVALIVSGFVDLLFTSLFKVYLKKGVYVLTYVNIVINLCVSMPRVLLVPPTKVDSRLRAFLGPYYFYEYIFFITLMNAVIWIEPLFCSEWFAKIGGHVWFDISLFVVMFLGILYAKQIDITNHGIGTRNLW
jgi:hypothetical protein